MIVFCIDFWCARLNVYRAGAFLASLRLCFAMFLAAQTTNGHLTFGKEDVDADSEYFMRPKFNWKPYFWVQIQNTASVLKARHLKREPTSCDSLHNIVCSTIQHISILPCTLVASLDRQTAYMLTLTRCRCMYLCDGRTSCIPTTVCLCIRDLSQKSTIRWHSVANKSICFRFVFKIDMFFLSIGFS